MDDGLERTASLHSLHDPQNESKESEDRLNVERATATANHNADDANNVHVQKVGRLFSLFESVLFNVLQTYRLKKTDRNPRGKRNARKTYA